MDNLVGSLRLSIGYTLVDITKTNELSSTQDSQARNQQRNFETLVQVLSLRAQLITMGDPELVTIDVANSKFGSDFKGEQAVWSFSFGIEQEAVFSDASGPYGTLAKDFANVPVILGLAETARIVTPTFTSSGNQQNIYFEAIRL